MGERTERHRIVPLCGRAAALFLAIGALTAGYTRVSAQGPVTAQTPQQLAPIDMTGQWVSVVTEDWRWRMVTPPKGDYSSVPLNPDGRRMADTCGPPKDNADRN